METAPPKLTIILKPKIIADAVIAAGLDTLKTAVRSPSMPAER